MTTGNVRPHVEDKKVGSRIARVLEAAAVFVILMAFWITLAVRDSDTANDGDDGATAVPGQFAAIASDCSRSVEAELNRLVAEAPDGSTLTLPGDACYGIDGPLVIAGKSNFTLDGDGATLRAITPGGEQRANIDVRRGTAISVVDVVVEGAFPGPSGDGLPGNGPRNGNITGTQHGVFLRSVQGATVRDVRAVNTGGDCVTAMSDYDPVLGFVGGPSRDVVIEGLDCRHTGRQGVAIVDAERVVVRDATIGDVYNCAVDIEPDVDTQLARDIRIEGVTFGSVRSAAICNGGQGASPNVRNVSVVGNRMTEPPSSCAGAVHVETSSQHQAGGQRRTGYRFVDNSFRSVSYGFVLSGLSDVEISGNTVERAREAVYACADFTRSPPAPPPAVFVRDVQRLHGARNRWEGYDEVVRADTASTDVQPLR